MLHVVQPELRAAASPALLARGCVNVIGLDPIKAEAGARWGKIKDGVHTRLESILRQNLSSADFFAPLSDTAFLITMPSSEPTDCQVTCLRIAYDLYNSYLGKCDFGTLALFTATEGENGSLMLNAIAQDALIVLAQRAGIGEARAPAQQTVTYATPAHENGAPMQFAPLWDSRKEAITGNVCIVERPSSSQQVSETATPFDAAARTRMKRELDALYRGVGVLAEHLEAGKRFLMVFRVAFETLGSPIGRMEFGAASRALPSDLRPYIIFKLTDVPPGVPQTRLAELIMALRPFAKAVMADAAPGQRNHAAYHGIGLAALGLDLIANKLRGREAVDEIIRIAAEAKRLSLSTYVSGVSDMAVLRVAHREGVHFLTGPIIAPARATPQPMRRLNWKDVLPPESDHDRLSRLPSAAISRV